MSSLRSVVERTVLKRSLLESLKSQAKLALLNPKRFVFCKPFGIVWALYAATYTAANASETITHRLECQAVEPVKLASTLLVNVPLGIWKDVQFGKIFGNKPAPPNVKGSPKAALGSSALVSRGALAAFLLRDALTIFGGFCLPGLMRNFAFGHDAATSHTQMIISQLTVPALMQIVATPAHLLGLDLCSSHAGSGRIRRVSQSLVPATTARCFRVVPAFGIGCVVNSELRSLFNKHAAPSSVEPKARNMTVFD